MKQYSGLLLAFAVPLNLAAAGVAHGQNVWNDVFSYCQQTDWRFGNDGVPTTNSLSAAAETFALPFDPDGDAARIVSKGNSTAALAFLSWLDAERSVPGECAIVVGTDEGGIYVVSEHGVESRCLKRYDMATGLAEIAVPTDSSLRRELVGPVFVLDKEGQNRLAGRVWRSPQGTETDWTDATFAETAGQIKDRLCANGLDFLVKSPATAGQWIAIAQFCDKPPTWLLVDVEKQAWCVLQEYPGRITQTRRVVFQYAASDGARLCGIFTRPEGTGPFPLVVFPHGGPGAISTADFDERVWALCDAGFAVFQPNYRGSAGFGKKFRFDGWGSAGIRRAMFDIKEGVDAVRDNRDCRIAECRPILLGGSWGGYCVLEQLAIFPGYYAGAISFFGAFDLPALLKDELRKVSELNPSESEIERRSLVRQFGDPKNEGDLVSLASISPVNQLSAIAEPVILFHNKDDSVISFAQSVNLYLAMTNKSKRAELLMGEGPHGFLPEKEAAVYRNLIPRMKQWLGI